MAKITIKAGTISVPATKKIISSFTAKEGAEIVDLWAAIWDNSAHNLATSGQATIAIYELSGETKVRTILEPIKVFAIQSMPTPLKIQHNPDKDNKIVIEADSAASEYVAYALRVATP